MKKEDKNLLENTPRQASETKTALSLDDLHDIGEDPYLLLADALEVLQDCDDRHFDAVHSQVVEDAQNLASRLLPQTVVDELGLHVDHMDDIGFEQPPSLRGLFLLIRSYDATGDPTLRTTIEYILSTVPPHFSEHIAEAFQRAQSTQRTVMKEFNDLAFADEQVVDGYVEGRPPFPSS